MPASRGDIAARFLALRLVTGRNCREISAGPIGQPWTVGEGGNCKEIGFNQRDVGAELIAGLINQRDVTTKHFACPIYECRTTA